MITLYEIEIGSQFRYKDDIYELQSIDDYGTAQAPRIGTVRFGQVFSAPKLINNNFNAYAEIEPGNFLPKTFED